MEKVIHIIDINGKPRDVLYVHKITMQIPDRVNGGIVVTKNYAEVIIIGHFRSWKEWYPLEQFLDMNPDVVVS